MLVLHHVVSKFDFEMAGHGNNNQDHFKTIKQLMEKIGIFKH